MRRGALPFASAFVLSSGIHVAAALLLGPLEGGVRVSGAEGLLVSLAPPPVVPDAGEAAGPGGGTAAEETEAAGRRQPSDPAPVKPKAAAEALHTARSDAPDPAGVRRAAPVSSAAAPERREVTAEAPAEVVAAGEVPPDAADLPAPPWQLPSSSSIRAEGGAPDLVGRPEPAPRRTTAGGIPARPDASAAIGRRDYDGERASAVEDYHARLRAWLERHKRYPRRARRRREQGVVVLRFVADRMGAVLDLEVEGTSGHPLLDEAALDMVRRAQPLPKMPPAMHESRAEHLLPVRFALR